MYFIAFAGVAVGLLIYSGYSFISQLNFTDNSLFIKRCTLYSHFHYLKTGVLKKMSIRPSVRALRKEHRTKRETKKQHWTMQLKNQQWPVAKKAEMVNINPLFLLCWQNRLACCQECQSIKSLKSQDAWSWDSILCSRKGSLLLSGQWGAMIKSCNNLVSSVIEKGELVWRWLPCTLGNIYHISILQFVQQGNCLSLY